MSLGFVVLTFGVEGTSYLYDTTTLFPKSGLEVPELIMKASHVTLRLKERRVYWRDGDVIQEQ